MEALAVLIEEKSGVKISLSTLKRLWKPDFDQSPHPSTLDALVSVLDCQTWWEFKEQYRDQLKTTRKGISAKRLGAVLAVVVLGVLVAGLLAINLNGDMQSISIEGPVIFTANKTVSKGVPNTVVFEYDVSNVNADSFFIQQSWNEVHKEAIDAAAGKFSSTYYTPGFHRAKLIAGDSIILQSRVHITTDGWMALARYRRDDLVPIYIRDSGLAKGGYLQILPTMLKREGVDINRKFTLSYHNIREFQGLHSDNFTLDTRLKVDSLGNYACPEAQITILCEEHIFYVPLTTRGCVGNLSVKFGEVVRDGKDTDFRAFGKNIHQWQDVSVRVQNKKAAVWLNQKLVYSTEFQEDFGLIMGLVVSFTGAGAVDHILLKDIHSNVVLEDEFH